MLRELWGDWRDGKLKPRRFIVLYLVVWLAIFVYVVGGGTLLYAATVGQGAGPVHSALKTVSVAAIIFLLWLILAFFNITIKRGRDIGLSGFMTGIFFLVLIPVAGISIFFLPLMALIPADTMRSSPGLGRGSNEII